MVQKNFLRRGNADSKPRLISWETLSCSKKMGGLGIGGIIRRNKALLGKVLWRSPREQTSLWASIVREKIGHGAGGWNSRLSSSFSSPKSLERYFSNLSSLSPSDQHSLGDCSRIWIDKWPSYQMLSAFFPRIYNLSLKKTRYHRRFYQCAKWNLHFRRNPEMMKLMSYPPY